MVLTSVSKEIFEKVMNKRLIWVLKYYQSSSNSASTINETRSTPWQFSFKSTRYLFSIQFSYSIFFNLENPQYILFTLKYGFKRMSLSFFEISYEFKNSSSPLTAFLMRSTRISYECHFPANNDIIQAIQFYLTYRLFAFNLNISQQTLNLQKLRNFCSF